MWYFNMAEQEFRYMLNRRDAARMTLQGKMFVAPEAGLTSEREQAIFDEFVPSVTSHRIGSLVDLMPLTQEDIDEASRGYSEALGKSIELMGKGAE